MSLAFSQFRPYYKIGLTCTGLTNFCLFTTLAIRWTNYNYFPLSNLYESLLFLAWALTFIHILLEYKYKNIIVGAVSSPISLFIISFADFSLPAEMQTASPLVPALRSNWLMMHVTVMMISYASLIIGSLLSILFLIISINYNKDQNKRKSAVNTSGSIASKYSNTKRENNYAVSKMTLLASIDNLSYRTIGLGFPLLTIGIIAGAVWANEAWGSYWSWDPKETWALITWLIFASYLHSRLNKSWVGKKPAILAAFGFLVVWICYLGVNFLGKGLHSYGWLQ